MDSAAKKVNRLIEHVIPAQPHHLSLSHANRYPAPTDFWQHNSRLQYTTYVSGADRGVLLTRPAFDIQEEAAADDMAASSSSSSFGGRADAAAAATAKKAVTKMSFKDYQQSKQRKLSDSPPDSGLLNAPATDARRHTPEGDHAADEARSPVLNGNRSVAAAARRPPSSLLISNRPAGNTRCRPERRPDRPESPPRRGARNERRADAEENKQTTENAPSRRASASWTRRGQTHRRAETSPEKPTSRERPRAQPPTNGNSAPGAPQRGQPRHGVYERGRASRRGWKRPWGAGRMGRHRCRHYCRPLRLGLGGDRDDSARGRSCREGQPPGPVAGGRARRAPKATSQAPKGHRRHIPREAQIAAANTSAPLADATQDRGGGARAVGIQGHTVQERLEPADQPGVGLAQEREEGPNSGASSTARPARGSRR